MNWEVSKYWYTRERYEIRMVQPNVWVCYGPDGWVDMDSSLSALEALADEHLKLHPIMPL